MKWDTVNSAGLIQTSYMLTLPEISARACQILWSLAAASRRNGSHSPDVKLIQCESLCPCVRNSDVPAILGSMLHELRATSSLLISPTHMWPSNGTSSLRLFRAAEASVNACNSRIAALRLMCEYSSVVAAWLIR